MSDPAAALARIREDAYALDQSRIKAKDVQALLAVAEAAQKVVENNAYPAELAQALAALTEEGK